MSKRLVTIAALALAACSGGEDTTTVVPPDGCGVPAPSPSADAGSDRVVARGVAAVLDAAASVGHRGAGLSYAWRIVEAPERSGARLSSETAATTTLTPDAAGVYVIGLAVGDGCAQSPLDTVTLVATNAPPVAHAGSDQAVAPGAIVQLDGSASSDPEGDALAFAWTLAARPEGSSATLSSATSPVPRFTADAPGVYVAVLAVDDGADASTPVAVTVTAGPQPVSSCDGALATAHAGPDRETPRGTTVWLNGSGSSSPRTSSLTYRWSLEAVPAGSASALMNAAYVNAAFTPDRPGAYVASLVVYDACGPSAPDTIAITVPNGAPVADAGPDRAVPRTGEVALDGSGSADPDGDPLTWAWEIVSRPAGSDASLSGATGPRPVLTVDGPGTYVVSLVVRDPYDASVADTLTLTAANRAPMARVAAPLPAAVGSTVSLDGRRSSDPDGDPLSYAWALERPPGSAAVLSDPTSATPSFTFDVDGPFRLTLTVGDGALSGTATTFVAMAGVLRQLPFDVVDAEWSDALDRLVLAAADPAALVLFDPASGTSDAIPLPLAPTALALSPDGLTAAVGHDAWISTVDLAAKARLGTIPVPWSVSRVALAGNGFVHAIARMTYSQYALRSMELATGVEYPDTASPSYSPSDVQVTPDGSALYVVRGYGMLSRYALSGGPPTFQWNAPSSATLRVCNRVWIAPDGARGFTACGERVRLSSAQAADMVYAGTLAGIGSSTVRTLDHSAKAGRIAVIYEGSAAYPLPDPDTQLRLHDDVYLATEAVMTLPRHRVGTTEHAVYGRHVFLDASGTRTTSVVQVDPYANVANDWFVIAY